MSKTTSELLLEIMQIYKEREWETKKKLDKGQLVKFLDKILENISANEIIDNKTEKKIINKLINEADKNMIIDIKNNVLDTKRSYKLINKAKKNIIIDAENNVLDKKRVNKLINKANKNIIIDAENNVLDKKRVNELINEVKDNNVVDTEYNDLESESNIKNFWKRKEYCNLKFTIKEILFVLVLLILLSFGAHVARKNMISENNNKFSVFNDILYFISNLLSIT